MRRLIPILIIVCAFVAFPPLLREFFPLKLPAAELVARKSPPALTDFTFLDGSGRSLTLDHFRGTFILVNVSATWCPPCKEEMASLDHLVLSPCGQKHNNRAHFDRRLWSSKRAVFLRKVRLEKSFDLR